MIDGAVAGRDVKPVGRGRRWWAGLRVVLVAVWALWAVASWWTAPRQESLADARADLAAGRVAAYEWGDEWEGRGKGVTFGWVGQPLLRSSGEPGPLYVWRTTTGQVRYTNLFGDGGDTGVAAVVEELGRRAAAAGVEFGDVAGGRLQRTGTVLLPLLGLSCLVLLVSGPAPVSGTKWFWWWVIGGVPLGLGLLVWLAREHPWSPGARPPQGRSGREPRHRGFFGLGLAIAAGLVGLLLAVGLNRLFGDVIVPVGWY